MDSRRRRGPRADRHRSGRILRGGTSRLRDAAARTAAEWERCCADADAALRAVEAETLATRYRLRAVRDRWIPRLEQALAEMRLALEEQELADSARLCLAARSGAETGQRPAVQGTTALPDGDRAR